MIKYITIIFLVFSHHLSYAQDEHTYKITLLRAAPGELEQLIDYTKEIRQVADGNLLIMRHSQGDHWDLMLVSPFDGIETTDYREYVDFQHDFIAVSETDWQVLKSDHQGNGLYHIEMFHAPKGKHNELLEERQMENIYLEETDRDGNAIFVTKFGSDVDVFTLGFYKDMSEFAAEPNLPDSAFENAAKKAGFSSRSDIGFHLRKFILRHNDTLATPVN